MGEVFIDYNNNVYNKYSNIDMLSHNIVSYLLKNNEDIWKLLKYNTSNALSQPNLTKDDKSNLIYSGQTSEEPYRVFTKSLPIDATEYKQTQLRIWLGKILPTNNITGQIDMYIQIISHSSIITLDSYSRNRNEVMLRELISTLNGQEISGITPFSFNQLGNGLNNEALWGKMGEKYYEGYLLKMSCKVSSVQPNGMNI